MTNTPGTFDTQACKNADLNRLINIFSDLGVRQLYVKKLAPNDNSKNQPYFGSHLTDLSFIPTGELVPSTTESRKTSDPKRQIKYQTSVNLSWVDADGQTYPAPNSKLIYYPQYPEVRFSGFLHQSKVNASEWMAPDKQGRSLGRWLILGITPDGNVYAYLVTPECALSQELEASNFIEISSVFGQIDTAHTGITDTKPCFASYPMPGVQPILVDSQGTLVEGNDVEGLLCVKFPWPSMLRTTYGDHERCRMTYFSSFENLYFTGDGARRDADGRYRIIGRVDDVINVSGHRMGTAEVENAIDEHPNVVESAVVGYPHDIKGQGIYAYIIVNEAVADEDAFRKEVLAVVVKEIGPIAKPDKIQLVSGLPKTRSGKIMRRILRKVASGETSNLGDISTLLNPEVVEEVINGALT